MTKQPKTTTPARRAKIVAALKACVAAKANRQLAGYLGRKALAMLPADGELDHRLVASAMRLSFSESVATCGTIPAAFAPIAVTELARAAPKLADAMFLAHYVGTDPDDPAGRLHAAAAWLHAAECADPDDTSELRRLARDADGMAAACATVVHHGTAASRLFGLLAYAGDDAAVDALVELFEHAISTRDDALDDLAQAFVPYARGPRMKRLAAEITQGFAARAKASPLLALVARWPGNQPDKVRVSGNIASRPDRAHVYFTFHSHDSPRASLTIFGKAKSTEWEDGKLTCDELKLGAPRDLEDVPRWLAAAATKLKVRWTGTLRFGTSLRGRQSVAMRTWLFPEWGTGA